MTPQLQALKAALDRFDRLPLGIERHDARDALIDAAVLCGFDMAKAVENWARYQVAVGEAQEQFAEIEEREAETREMFS